MKDDHKIVIKIYKKFIDGNEQHGRVHLRPYFARAK
jgi:hypothetical protein